MKCILFIVFFMAGFLSVSAQTYNEWIDKSFECIESEDWTGAEKALIGALRVQPANPQNMRTKPNTENGAKAASAARPSQIFSETTRTNKSINLLKIRLTADFFVYICFEHQ